MGAIGDNELEIQIADVLITTEGMSATDAFAKAKELANGDQDSESTPK